MAAHDDAGTRLRERGRLLIALLRRGKRDHQRSILVWGGLRILATLAVGALVLVMVAALAPILPRPLGVVLGVLAWAGLAFLLWRHWLRPLRAIPNLAVFSRLVEQRRDFRDMLRAALEFSERGVPSGGSSDLTASTVDRAYDEARKLDLTALFQFPDKRRDAMLVVISIACIAVLQLLAPHAPQRALASMKFAYPSPASIVYGDLEVVGGSFEILAGDDVVVRLRDHGPLAPEMLLRFNDTGDLWKTRRLEPQSARAPWEYEFRFENVRDHTLYRFESGKRHTAQFDIQVVQRPIVSRFSIKLVPPPYTRREPAVLEEGRGDAIALFGTEIQIEGTASSPLAGGWIVPEGDATGERTLPRPLEMSVEGNGFSGGFTLRGDLRYHFSITDQRGNQNGDPVTYQLSAIEDRPPYVELRDPEGDATIPKSMRVPLVIYASDDFGVSRMTVVYQHEREGEPVEEGEKRANLRLHGPSALDPDGQPLGRAPAPEVIKTYDWDLTPLGLYPGDAVTFYVEVEDNDEFSGHKTARTPTYRLRLPSLGELYADIQDQDDNRMSELDEVLEQGRELQQKYEQMARELKKRPEMDWKKEQEIQKALEKQKELADRVSDLAEQLQDEVDRMEQQQLVNSEIAEKMEEIRELMQNIQDDALREYMERLQEAMKQISPEEIQRAMEQMELSQEEFLKRLERTKALLEQLAREQKLDSLVERTAEILERQEDLTDRTQKLNEKAGDPKDGEQEDGEQQDGEQKDGEEEDGEQQDGKQQDGEQQQSEQDAERLAQEQEQLAEQMRQLEEELAQLNEEMQNAERQELNDANQQMQEQQPSEPMEQAGEQLQQQQPQQAQENQEESERRLRSLYEQLMQAQMAMSQNMSQETAIALSKAARQSLDVSFRQEHLSREGAPVGDYESTGDLARRQKGLLAATERVVEGLDELAKESLQVPSHVSALLGQAMNKMEQGVEAYEKGNALAGRIHGEDSYGDLNRAVIELNRSARSCSQGSGGGQTSRERMGQMAERQQQLNDATQRLRDALQNPQSLSPEEREAMSRLLGEQRSIAEELRDIQQQAQDQRDLLGRMDKLLDEVKEVVEDMESESLGDETSRVQERILSRMLQAQRSLHKRDYNKQRESRSVEEVYSEGGKALEESEEVKKLRRDILRALESGTPEEYQELVRQYFRAIAEGEEKDVP